MANIQQRKNAPVSLIEFIASNAKKIENHLAKAVPLDQFMAAVAMCVRRDPKLAACDPSSFLASVEFCAGLQLIPGGGRSHVYLVPYGPECTPIIGYKGMLALAQRCGAAKSVARLVYEGDEFDIVYGTEDKVLHKPALRDRGAVIGAYAVIHMRSGERIVEYMSVDELDAIKNRAAGNRKGPWSTDEPEMQRKTVFRRAFKWVPVDPGMERILEAVQEDEYGDAGVPRDVPAEVVKRDAPSDLEGLASDLAGDDKPAAEDWSPAEDDEPLTVDDGLDAIDAAGLPAVPWDDAAEHGGYPFPAEGEAGSIGAWIDDEVPYLKMSWRAALDSPEADPVRIRLSKATAGGAREWAEQGKVHPIAVRAAIVEAILASR